MTGQSCEPGWSESQALLLLPSTVSQALLQYPDLQAPSCKPPFQPPHFVARETEMVRHLPMAAQQVEGRTCTRTCSGPLCPPTPSPISRHKDPILDPAHFLLEHPLPSVLSLPLALAQVEGTKFLIRRLHCAYCLTIDD